MRGFALILALLLTAAAPAVAGERVLVPDMVGWKVVDNHAEPDIETTDLIPAEEAPDSWTRRLSIQAYRGATMSAEEFLEGLVERTDEVCDGIFAEPVQRSTVDGAPAGRRGIACGRYRGDGKGSYTLFFAIRGTRALYVLAAAARGAPFSPGVGTSPMPETERAEWLGRFGDVHLCNTVDTAHPCPR